MSKTKKKPKHKVVLLNPFELADFPASPSMKNRKTGDKKNAQMLASALQRKS